MMERSTVNDGKIDFDTNTINEEGSGNTDSLTKNITNGSGTITLAGGVSSGWWND